MKKNGNGKPNGKKLTTGNGKSSQMVNALMEPTKPVVSSLSIGEAQALSEGEIKASVFLARSFPRNEMEAYSKVMETCGRTSFAATATYSFPRGGTLVQGASIDLAREIARNWKNIIYGYIIVFDDEHKRSIRCWAFDTENNIRTTTDDTFEKLIYRKSGGWIIPDERDLRELTSRKAAIGVRNCLLQLFPKDIIEDAMVRSKETLKAGAKQDPKGTMKTLVLWFQGYGVDVPMLEKYLEHSLDTITADEVADLHGIAEAIKDGTAKVKEFFGVQKQKVEEEQPVEIEFGAQSEKK